MARTLAITTGSTAPAITHGAATSHRLSRPSPAGRTSSTSLTAGREAPVGNRLSLVLVAIGVRDILLAQVLAAGDVRTGLLGGVHRLLAERALDSLLLDPVVQVLCRPDTEVRPLLDE